MSTLIASALVAGFFILSGAHAASAPDTSAQAAVPSISVTLTSYNAVPSQTDGDPMTTASGLPSNPEVIAARSQDLADELPFGTVIAIEPAQDSDTPNCHFDTVASQIGYRVIGDVMNARMHDRVDILLNQNDTVKVDGVPMNPSRALGLCTGVTIKVVGKIDLSHVPQTQEELVEMVDQANLALDK